jgi:hypothetical protein
MEQISLMLSTKGKRERERTTNLKNEQHPYNGVVGA